MRRIWMAMVGLSILVLVAMMWKELPALRRYMRMKRM